MKPQAVGDFAIRAVVEATMPERTPAEMFPTADADMLAAHMEWMVPEFAEADTGLIRLAYQSFVVETPRANILVDTCIGNHKPRRYAQFNMRNGPWLDNLQALGYAPEAIDVVMCTHMHPDHAGWNTRLEDGRWVPTFPNARYIFARDESEYWEADSAGGASTRIGDTFIDSVLPVMEAGLAELVDGDFELERGIHFEPTPGHTPGHVVVHLQSNGDAGVLSGDLMHSPVQVREPHWSTCFCMDMEMSAQSRIGFVDAHADTGTLIVPCHFGGETAGRIVGTAGGGTTFDFVD